MPMSGFCRKMKTKEQKGTKKQREGKGNKGGAAKAKEKGKRRYGKYKDYSRKKMNGCEEGLDLFFSLDLLFGHYSLVFSLYNWFL